MTTVHMHVSSSPNVHTQAVPTTSGIQMDTEVIRTIPVSITAHSVGVQMQSNVNDAETSMSVAAEYAPREGGGGALPYGGKAGDLLAKRSSGTGDAEWVTPADSAEQDNTRPITAAAVYTEIGNINALLATI